MADIGRITQAMIEFYAGDPRRIHHFLKVYGFAKAIGELEGLDGNTQDILEAAALCHDIGIKISEQKYQSSAGPYQQIEGPPEAERLLRALGCGEALIGRVCWLIARHHTYDNIEGLGYQILIEADFLVNSFEQNLPAASIRNFRDKIFKTAAGTRFINLMYRLGDGKEAAK